MIVDFLIIQRGAGANGFIPRVFNLVIDGKKKKVVDIVKLSFRYVKETSRSSSILGLIKAR